jgi:hypothetical protein
LVSSWFFHHQTEKTMEKLRGTLVVEEINGRRGPFCVGMLKTSIGDFKVTDKELDQFAPGSYAGDFLIEELRTKTVPWRQGTFTYIQAIIAEGGFLIDEEAQLHPEGEAAPQAEPDPLDSEEQPGPDTPTAPASQPAADHKPAESAPEAPEPDDEAVFGIELYPQFAQRQSPIALDTTVDRGLFRQQRERLKAAGYRFNSVGQNWTLESHS